MSSATSAARGRARSSTAGRFLISKIVFAVGARARITLACRGQKGVRSMNWMCLRHHPLFDLSLDRDLVGDRLDRRVCHTRLGHVVERAGEFLAALEALAAVLCRG